LWYGKTDHNVFQGVMMGSYDKQLRKYGETITAMDRDIGRLLDQIDKSGFRDNTVVVYMGDNGMMWGEHHLHGIKYPYEESIRLPFIVRAPWLIRDPGSRRSQIALNIDIGPTLLDLAGIPIPGDMEGVSLMPYLMNRKVSGRKAFLLEFWQYYPERCPTYFGVRTKTHKYVEYQKGWEPMLFDLTADPKESRNLYNTPEGEKILSELKELLEKLKKNKKLR
jgi:arylsulfatase A-like enzyme